MTDDTDDTDTGDIERPPVWLATLDRFRDVYGSEFDPESGTDVWLLVQLLEEAVHHRITRGIVKTFREATVRIKAESARMDAEAQARRDRSS